MKSKFILSTLLLHIHLLSLGASTALLLLAGSGTAAEVLIPADGDWGAAIEALQPGDVGLLEPGRYTGGYSVTVQGEPDSPVVIRGAGHLESIFDGETGAGALSLIGCSDVVVENVQVTNASPYGWGLDAKLGEFDYYWLAREMLASGISVSGGERITVRESRFSDIATCALCCDGWAGYVNGMTVEHNLFIRTGDDTAGADYNPGGCVRWTARENLFAGNIDGVVGQHPGGEGLVERNLFVFERWENAIDLKFHHQILDEDPWSTIRWNVIYADRCDLSGIEIQDTSSNLRVYGNVVHGTTGLDSGDPLGLQIRGRSGGACENIEIVGNWFDAMGSGVTGINIRVQESDPGDVRGVWILHNVFTGYRDGLTVGHGEEISVYNNIFSISPVEVSWGGVSAGTNLYDGVDPWAADGTAITGTPVYSESPVGPLAAGSPGKGAATILSGHDFGPDVGIPADFAGLGGLERSILCALQEVFTFEEIRECMRQGDRPYEEPLECGAEPPPDEGREAVPEEGEAGPEPRPESADGEAGSEDAALDEPGDPDGDQEIEESQEGCGCRVVL